MEHSTSLFIELLQVALGTRDQMSRCPSSSEWEAMYREARRHCVVGVCLQALQKDDGQWGVDNGIPLDLKLKWIGKGERISDTNHELNQQCKKLSDKLTASGYWNCILKGQGIALLYPNPYWRESGDIDIWVRGNRNSLVEMTRRISGRKEAVTYHHTSFHVFPDTVVELHFTPSWFFNPFRNRRLQRWFNTHYEVRTDTEFPIPTTAFNTLYILQHIYRHIFDDGIGLRQIIDYYYVLKENRGETIPDLKRFGLLPFARGLMWMMQQTLGLPKEWMIAVPDERLGEWLRNEILQAGNFGHNDHRFEGIERHTRTERFNWHIRQVLRRCRLFPSESLWEIPWRSGQFLWRLCHGYLG